jgi:5'-3' exonuclease
MYNLKGDFNNYNVPIFTYMPKKKLLLDFLAYNYNESYGKINHLNIFVDLKGCLRNIYMEDIIAQIYQISKENGISYFILDSIMNFITTINRWLVTDDIPFTFDFIFFWESGGSIPHNLDSKGVYKLNRNNMVFKIIDKQIYKEFSKVKELNFRMFEKIGPHIPRVNIVSLKSIEADFIPYYLIKYSDSELINDNSVNLILSSDKDMFQGLDLPNTYQYIKKSSRSSDNNDYIISGDGYFPLYFKNLKGLEDFIPADLFSFILSIQGDSSDNVNGFKRYGPKKSYEVINKLLKSGTLRKVTMEQIIDGLFFKEDHIIKNSEEEEINIEEFIKKDLCSLINVKGMTNDEVYENLLVNLKLTSFEYLSQLIENHKKPKGDILMESYSKGAQNDLREAIEDSIDRIESNKNSKKKINHGELIALLKSMKYDFIQEKLQYLYL